MYKIRLPLAFLAVVLSLFIGAGKVHASHVYGAAVTYQCLNACTTRVHLRAYRDCTGSSAITTNITWLPAQSGCTLPNPLNTWSGQVTTEIAPVCPSSATSCTVPGAAIGGFEEYYWFRDYDVCTGPPCDFRLVYSDCCRNPTITGFPVTTNQLMTISDTWIRTGQSSCNSSPEFRNPPLNYICSGQSYYFDLGAYDVDGDSLVHQLSTCYTMDSVPATYSPGYSPTSPLGPNWTFTMDPATGLTSLLTSTSSHNVGPICMTVDEYRNGQWIGRVQRDFMVTTLACPANQVPTLQALTNLSANATANGNTVSVCGSGSVCFDLASADVDLGQNLLLTWDQSLAGASFSQVGAPSVLDSLTGTGAVPPVGRFCWTPPGPGTYVVPFRLYDNACPILGFAHKTVLIEVANGAVASATPGTCPSVDFAASACLPGSYTYTWSGDAGFSSTLQNPSFTYPAVGDYAWQVIVAGSGLNDTIRDTVHISADPVVLPTLFLPDTIALGPCLGPTSAVIAFSGSYFTYMSSTGMTTASFPVNQAGTYRGWAYDVAGCAFMDSVVVTWTDPDISGIASTSTAQPLVNQKVYLIRYDSVAQTLFAADSSITDAAGNYFFCGVTDSVVFLKAAPDSAAYPLEMPTYADTVLFWSQAIAFHPFASLPILHNFQTRAGMNPGGPGFVGGLITQGANKVSAVGDPVPGLTIVLKRVSSGDVYAVTRTDANGYFRFGNLPFGDYQVIPDKPAVSITNVPQVSLTAQVPGRDSLDFRLNSTFLELFVASAVTPGRTASGVTLSPNPFGGDIQLQVALTADAVLEWRIVDLLGQVVEGSAPAVSLPAGRHQWRIAQALAPGIYFVEVRLNGSTSLQKILKAR